MRVRRVWFLVFTPYCFGQDALSILQDNISLSMLFSFVNGSSTLTQLLRTANNFTFLAPTNTAVEQWLLDQGSTTPSQDEIDATFSYHLLHGTFSTAQFPSGNPQFVSSNLTSRNFSNVIDGQNVGLFSNRAGPMVLSGNKSVTAVASRDMLCRGGIVQIINDVLTIPLNIVDALQQANLKFAIGIFSAVGFLNSAELPIIGPIITKPDITFFIPNTQSALDNATAQSKNASQADITALLEYHIVPNFLGYFPVLQDGMVLKTAGGQDLHISIEGNATYVNSARITASNYLTTNGVFHVLDSLLDPNNTSPPDLNSHRHHSMWMPSTTMKIALGLGITAAVILLATILVFLHRRQRKKAAARQALIWKTQITRPRLPELDTSSSGGKNKEYGPVYNDSPQSSIEGNTNTFIVQRKEGDEKLERQDSMVKEKGWGRNSQAVELDATEEFHTPHATPIDSPAVTPIQPTPHIRPLSTRYF